MTIKVLATFAPRYRVPAGSGKPRDAYVKQFKEHVPKDWEVVVPEKVDQDLFASLAKDVDLIFGVNITRKVIESAPKLRMIQGGGTGVDTIDIEAADERGVIVCNAPGFTAVNVAEHALALMFALAKNVMVHDRNIRNGYYYQISSVSLKDKTLGIVGLGRSGVELAVRAKALGMKVMANKKHPTQDLPFQLNLDFLGGPGDLDYLLRESDFLVLALTSGKETKNLMGDREFSLMKPTSFFINIARGDIVDEIALGRALQERTIAGAGMDVYWGDRDGTVNFNHTIFKVQNTVLTPHVAGGHMAPDSEEYKERLGFMVGNMLRALRGEEPSNIQGKVRKLSKPVLD
jgi:D-3-phosphoglycerate dehydrogenase